MVIGAEQVVRPGHPSVVVDQQRRQRVFAILADDWAGLGIGLRRAAAGMGDGGISNRRGSEDRPPCRQQGHFAILAGDWTGLGIGLRKVSIGQCRRDARDVRAPWLRQGLCLSCLQGIPVFDILAKGTLARHGLRYQ